MSDSEGDIAARNTTACGTLSEAQSILLKWGITLPWAWHTWSDERILDYVVVEHTVGFSFFCLRAYNRSYIRTKTLLWLRHLGKHPCTWKLQASDWKHQAALALSRGLAPGCYIVTVRPCTVVTAWSDPVHSQVLLERAIATFKTASTSSHDVEPDVDERCCFAGARLLKWLREYDEPLGQRLCQVMLDLFAYMPDTMAAVEGAC